MEILPDDLWPNIFKSIQFKEILIMQFVSHKIKQFVLCRTELIEKDLKGYNHELILLPRYDRIGGGVPLRHVNLLWALKNKNFNDAVSDQQPRNANRGFGFFEKKWVWIRGPFEYRPRDSHGMSIIIGVFQKDTISSLCQHLKNYEVEYLCNFIDNIEIRDEIVIGVPIQRNSIPKKSICIIC